MVAVPATSKVMRVPQVTVDMCCLLLCSLTKETRRRRPVEPAEAKAGRIGVAPRISVKHGFPIDGEFQIDDDGLAPVLRWIRPHLEEDSVPAIAIGLRGHLGQMTGRLTGPVQFVRILKDSWHLSMPDAIAILGYDSDDFEHVCAVLDGRERFLGRDVRDRIAHLFCIRRALWSLFRDLDVENDWLREQHHMLSEKSPLSILLEGSMEALLLVREYVEAAAGLR